MMMIIIIMMMMCVLHTRAAPVQRHAGRLLAVLFGGLLFSWGSINDRARPCQAFPVVMGSSSAEFIATAFSCDSPGVYPGVQRRSFGQAYLWIQIHDNTLHVRHYSRDIGGSPSVPDTPVEGRHGVCPEGEGDGGGGGCCSVVSLCLRFSSQH